MIESIQPMPESLGGTDVVLASPPFYVVSRKKLAILHLATLGMYGTYWFYKNWSNYKHRSTDNLAAGRSVLPVPRALFSIFFIHALFREIKALGRDNAAVAAWNSGWHATQLVAMTIASEVFTRMSNRADSKPGVMVLSLVILVPLLSQFLRAQSMINISCGDPDGTDNSRLTTANYVWIVLGLLIWTCIILGLVLPDWAYED